MSNIKDFLRIDEMSDKQFEKLKRDIEVTIKKLESLQAKHRKETGKDYRPF